MYTMQVLQVQVPPEGELCCVVFLSISWMIKVVYMYCHITQKQSIIASTLLIHATDYM